MSRGSGAPHQPDVRRDRDRRKRVAVRIVQPDDIELFASVSEDANPAHLDAAFAAADPFGHVVAHGMWTAALVSAVLGTQLSGPGTIYLGQDLRFLKPVTPGNTITATVTVRS